MSQKIKHKFKNKEMWLNLIILNLSIFQAYTGFIFEDPKMFLYVTIFCNLVNLNCRFLNNEDVRKFIKDPELPNNKRESE